MGLRVFCTWGFALLVREVHVEVIEGWLIVQIHLCAAHRDTHAQAGTQTGRQPDSQTYIHTYRQTERGRQTGRQTDIPDTPDRHADRHAQRRPRHQTSESGACVEGLRTPSKMSVS
eukprot:365924-Rhodomonas_salina.1